MNGETIALLENFCRTCMVADKKNEQENASRRTKVISIFDHPDILECKTITIMDLLLLTIPQINIDSGDMLPKILCENCLDSLISAYKFQTMCITVEQKLQQMIKEAYPTEFESIKDPLKDSIIDATLENVEESQAINDLSNILKIEMDEPLIDQTEAVLCSKSAADDCDDIKFEINEERWQDTSESDSKSCETDSEWESPQNKVKRKKISKTVLKKDKKTIDPTSENKEDAQIKQTIDESKISNNSNENAARQFTCDECGNRLKTHKSLMRHKKIHRRTTKEDEQSSESNAETKRDLKMSNTKNDVNKNFECDECGNRLANRKSLKRHKRIHLRPVVEGQRNPHIKTKYECEFCKKVFQQSSSLKDHLRTHTGEQPYLCAECGKAFKSLSNMKQHFLRHGTDRPYICPDCPKRFPCLSDLASHKAVHNKTKSHVCDICGAAFVKPYLLKKHKMYHTGEKNHKCDYCDMRFVLADQCRRHMRTHTGEKPYKCKYCDRAFAQSNDLIKHLRGHLGDNVYKCDLCPQGFRLQMDLRAHFNTHKNDDEETKERNLQALRDEEHRLQMKFGFANCT